MLLELDASWETSDDQPQDWRIRVAAPSAVGSDVEISMWALMEHFLLTWIEWFQVSRLYSQYFGYGRGAGIAARFVPGLARSEFPGLPPAWASLHMRCQRVKDLVSTDLSLADTWAAAWRLGETQTPDDANDVESWFLLLTESHERRRLLQVFTGNKSWDHLNELVVAQDLRLAAALVETNSETRDAVTSHFRYYRHATLDASWLSPEGYQSPLDRTSENSSAMRWLTNGIGESAEWSTQVLENLELDADVRSVAQDSLSRIQQCVWEFGFDCFADDVCAKEFRPSSSGPLGSPSMTLNPKPPRTRRERKQLSDSARQPLDIQAYFGGQTERWSGGKEVGPIPPARIVMCVGQPGRGWKSIERTLIQLTRYLVEAPPPDLIIVLTDSWDSTAFRPIRSSLQTYSRAGIKFLFLLGDVPSRGLTKLDVSIQEENEERS